MKWIVVFLAALVGGWLASDGTRALVTGDYVTPKSGPYAGRLGPWADLVRMVGIEPRSTLMKGIYASYGFLWLGIVAVYVMGVPWGWRAMLIAALGSLWFVPVGTALGVVQVVLLLLLRR